MNESTNLLAFVLHAHLPMLPAVDKSGHPLERIFFDWCTDSLLPLLEQLEGLERDGVKGRLTLSLSTTLMAMLDDPSRRDRLEKHLNRRIELCEHEIERTASRRAFSSLAHWHKSRYTKALELFQQVYERDLLGAMARHFQASRLELITAVGTHPVVPLVGHAEVVRAHVRLAIDAFSERFGTPPVGMWLPECAYHRGIESDLARYGVRYTIVSPSALRPYLLPRDPVLDRPIAVSSGLALFARDTDAAREISSPEIGFTTEPRFLERRLAPGIESVEGELRGLAPATNWADGSLGYFGFGDRDGRRIPYQPERAEQHARERARRFVDARQSVLRRRQLPESPPPISVIAIDSQLLGLWWLEGPQFLDEVFRYSAATAVDIVTPSDYLNTSQPLLLRQPESTTWGRGSYLETWLNEDNEWLYRHLHNTEARLLDAVSKWRPKPGSWRNSALAQAARELLLAQTSDWAALLGRHVAADYASSRIDDHLSAANRFISCVETGRANKKAVADRANRWAIFPGLELSVFR